MTSHRNERRSTGTLAARVLVSLLPGLCLVFAAGCGEEEPNEPIILNFHTLDEGKAYRSPQLSGEALNWVIDRYGIKTVVNLRGHNPDKEWYQEEAAVCRDRNVALVDLSLSSQSLPEPRLLRSIVETLETAERPMLIHCQSGSDRSGMVSALYRIEVLGQDNEAAMRELSSDYWHFRDKKPCMDTLIEMYEPTAAWIEQYAREYQSIKCE